MQDFIFFFRSFAVWISVRNTAGFLGILPPPPSPSFMFSSFYHISAEKFCANVGVRLGSSEGKKVR